VLKPTRPESELRNGVTPFIGMAVNRKKEMYQQTKLKPMPDFAFRMMVWFMKLEDLFKSPEVLLQKVPLKEGMTVVDYACGPGRYTIPAAESVGRNGKVYAVDSQPLAMEMVKRKAALKSLANIQPVLVDSFNTGITDSSADIVLLIDAITPIKEHDALF
jgi:ubiquinone/menaquinone biosynthesis C-methylase UbiE